MASCFEAILTIQKAVMAFFPKTLTFIAADKSSVELRRQHLTRSHKHRHLRENRLLIGHSWKAGHNIKPFGGKSIHLPCIQRQIDFIAAAAAGKITTTVNKGRWPGQ